MTRGKTVVLSTRQFRTQTDAVGFFREMRGRYGVDERVQEADAEDLAALLSRHPSYGQKVGVGIGHFKATLAYGRGTPCFAIVRTDGTKEDFSFHKCITGKTANCDCL